MKIYAALSLSMPLRQCQPFAALHFTETQREGYFTNTRAYKERLLNSLKGSSESIQCVFLCNDGLSWDVESIEHWLIYFIREKIKPEIHVKGCISSRYLIRF